MKFGQLFEYFDYDNPPEEQERASIEEFRGEFDPKDNFCELLEVKVGENGKEEAYVKNRHDGDIYKFKTELVDNDFEVLTKYQVPDDDPTSDAQFEEGDAEMNDASYEMYASQQLKYNQEYVGMDIQAYNDNDILLMKVQ